MSYFKKPRVIQSEPQEQQLYGENIIDYIQRVRLSTRKSAKFHPPERWASSLDKPDSRFNLTPKQLEWFFPVSKEAENWEYEGDYLDSGNKANKAYLEEHYKLIEPGDEYFDEEELPALLASEELRTHPPIYHISKYLLK